LLSLDLRRGESEPNLVIGAAFVGDEDHLPQGVDAVEKAKLLLDPLAFPEGQEAAGKAGRPSRAGETVVPGQAQPMMKKLVELIADPAVAAVDGRGVDARFVVGGRALINDAAIHGRAF